MAERGDPERHRRREIHRQALSIALAIAPFGVAFGIACTEAGLSTLHAVGFSTLVFSGSAQFAAVGVLGDGGGVLAAISTGLLLNLRSLAFGVVMAPALAGSWWRRALAAQLMIDESTAIGAAQADLRWRRYGYLAGGIGVFVTWNTSTLLGAVLFSSAGDLILRWGIDATIPAAFLALLWPRLARRDQAATAVAGAALALALVPLTPAGVPILGSVAAVAVGWRGRRRRREAEAA